MLAPRITAPTQLPVPLEYVKAHSVVDFADDDALLDAFIRAATGYLDGPSGILGRAVMDQEVVQRFRGFKECLRLPYGQVRSMTGLTYYDLDNVEQPFTGGHLIEGDTGEYIQFEPDLPATFDRPDAVSVTYRAGWADSASVPESLKLAICMMCATWYEMREDVAQASQRVPLGVKELVAPWRRVGV